VVNGRAIYCEDPNWIKMSQDHVKKEELCVGVDEASRIVTGRKLVNS
jgi:hypothetical protein